MNETLTLMLVWMLGLLLGAFFFAGLWWTIRKGLASAYPAFWFIGSLLLRTGVTLAGFYFVASHHWQQLPLCLLGFVMARPLVTWLTRTKQTHLAQQESRHAPES